MQLGRWGQLGRFEYSRRALPLCLALTMAGLLAAEQPTPPLPAGDPTQWVAQLNSDDFDERNAASENLARLGEAARPALGKGANSADPEIKAASLFTAGHLPAGDYKLIMIVKNQAGQPAPATQVTEFSVKAGEKLQLPEFKFNFPAPTKEELDEAEPDDFGSDGADEDNFEEFKP